MDALVFSQYAIFALLIALMILPVRYAYFALLLLGFFDASGPGFASASTVGVANALKVVAAPAVMLIRLRFTPLRMLLHGRGKGAFYAFLLLILYAGLAILWSNWKLSGLKLIGYLLGHLLWFAVIAYGWLSGRIGRKILGRLLATAVVLGFVQSYIVEPVFGVYQFEGQRFTAFLSPQYYAAFLVFITSVLVFVRGRLVIGMVLLGVILGVVVATGSRYSFLGLLFVAGCFLAANLRDTRSRYNAMVAVWSVTMAVGFLMLLSAFGYGLPLGRLSQHTRIGELQYVITNPEKIGTLAWRLAIYKETIEQISMANLSQIVFGHGTASGAEVALIADPVRYRMESIDANRVIHNEFLRALYEWGLVGVALLAFLITFIVVSSIKPTIAGRSLSGYALFAALPMLVLSLSIENVLASAGSSWGVGFALVLGAAYAEWQGIGMSASMSASGAKRGVTVPGGAADGIAP